MPWAPKHLPGPLLDGLSLCPFAGPVWLPRSCAERAGGVVCQLLADESLKGGVLTELCHFPILVPMWADGGRWLRQ